jgi:hypothetical protein
MFLNSVLLFWKLLVFEFLFGIPETLLCSVSTPHVKIVPLLDAYLLPMFAEIDITITFILVRR